MQIPAYFTDAQQVNLLCLLLISLAALPFALWSGWSSLQNLVGAVQASRTYREPLWAPLQEFQLSEDFKRYIAEQSQPPIALGYQPLGAFLASAGDTVRTKAACFLHPKGHSIVEIMQIQCDEEVTFTIEVLSLLDDGSVISSINMDDAVTSAMKQLKTTRKKAQRFVDQNPIVDFDKHLDEMEPHGFMVLRHPGAKIEEMMESHKLAVETALKLPAVGVRKLTPSNWREHMFYEGRRFGQIMFELGRMDNAPEPFRFPNGELVG